MHDVFESVRGSVRSETKCAKLLLYMGLSVPFSIGLILADPHVVRHKTKQKSLPLNTFSGLKIAENTFAAH